MKEAAHSWIISFLMLLMVIFFFARCAQENTLTQADGTLSIDSISPTEGVPGSQLRIYGKGFALMSKGNTVTINGVEVPVDTSSVGTILVTISQEVTTGPVVVKRELQIAQGPVFTITAPPDILSVQPDQGFAGDQILISGSGFDQVMEVLFNGVAAVISSRSDSELLVVAPASSTGTITFNYNGGVIEGPVFTYLQIPLIENVEQIFGRPSYLHITGTYFNQNPSSLKVYLSGDEVPIVDQLLDEEPSHLLIGLPDPGGENPVQIIVEANGVQSLPYEFTMMPNMFTFDFQQNSIVGNNITYDFQIEGEYFGNAGPNKSVEIRHTGTGAFTIASISSWDPGYITGQFTVDPTTLGNDAFAVSVVVNGVRSPEIEFRP